MKFNTSTCFKEGVLKPSPERVEVVQRDADGLLEANVVVKEQMILQIFPHW